jgi:hypothetical protein
LRALTGEVTTMLLPFRWPYKCTASLSLTAVRYFVLVISWLKLVLLLEELISVPDRNELISLLSFFPGVGRNAGFRFTGVA